jgi:hypothetical protein
VIKDDHSVRAGGRLYRGGYLWVVDLSDLLVVIKVSHTAPVFDECRAVFVER